MSALRSSLSPPPLAVDFGAHPVLRRHEVELQLLNLGRAPLSIRRVGLAGDAGAGAFEVGAYPEQVASGDTGALVVAFRAPHEASFADVLAFDTDDEAHRHVEVALSGTGRTVASASVGPSRLDFGSVGECASAVADVTLTSSGTAALVLEGLGFTEGTAAAFAFVGSTRMPAVVPVGGTLAVTVRVSPPAGAGGALSGTLRLVTTDPLHRELLVPLVATVNRAPVPRIASQGLGALGQLVTLDGTASTDPDGDAPLAYAWTLRTKPLLSATTLAEAQGAVASMQLDPSVPGAYEVELDVTDARGVTSCTPARATLVATPAQKLLVEMFWDNAGTDLDLHVRRAPQAAVGSAPDDCFYQNRAPDWGMPGTTEDDPLLERDALVGYGPERFGYVNPVEGTYRVAVLFANELVAPSPTSTATLRVSIFGVLKAELTHRFEHQGEVWDAADIAWPQGDVRAVP